MIPTLWELAESWPCDYVTVNPASAIVRKGNGKRPPAPVSVHAVKCQRCDLKKLLLLLDEKLKSAATITPEQFKKAAGEQAGEYSDEYLEATREHAQFVREEFLGCPK